MPETCPLRVLKFGSSVLGSPSAYPRLADLIRAEVDAGAQVVAVVSAMGDTTDRLLADARDVAPSTPDHLMAPLLVTGEEASTALLALALAERGVRALGVPFWRLPVRTRGPLTSADPVAVDAEAIRTALATHDALVLPGFVGVDGTGAISLLGRGGSDLTALFLGHALGAAEVRLVKDVDGIFSADPKYFPDSTPLTRTTWNEALRIGGGVVQERALRFARQHGITFRVASPGGTGTWIGRRGAERRTDDRAAAQAGVGAAPLPGRGVEESVRCA